MPLWIKLALNTTTLVQGCERNVCYLKVIKWYQQTRSRMIQARNIWPDSSHVRDTILSQYISWLSLSRLHRILSHAPSLSLVKFNWWITTLRESSTGYDGEVYRAQTHQSLNVLSDLNVVSLKWKINFISCILVCCVLVSVNKIAFVLYRNQRENADILKDWFVGEHFCISIFLNLSLPN